MIVTVTTLEQMCSSHWQGRTVDGLPISIHYQWGYLTVDLDGVTIYEGQHGDALDNTLGTSAMVRLLHEHQLTIAVHWIAPDVH